MQGLGKALRERAAALGLSDSEVARRTGLSQARYHNYVAETAEPDLGTLVRICRTLATSPDGVLDFAQSIKVCTDDELHRARMMSAASLLEGETLAYTADVVEAMVVVQRKKLRAGAEASLKLRKRILVSSANESSQANSEAVSGEQVKTVRRK